MSYFNKLKEGIEAGKRGDNLGIPTGFTNLDYYLGGVRKGVYTLCGSNTGVGKTAFVDFTYVISPLLWLLNEGKDSGFKLKVFYYSKEIDLLSKLSKWACLLLFLDKGIIVDSDVILSAKRDKKTKELKKIPKEIEDAIELLEPYFNYLEENVLIEETPVNPTGMYKAVKNYCDAVGEKKKEKRIIEQVIREVDVYYPNNPKEVVLWVVDHIGLVKGEKDNKSQQYLGTKKTIIDKTDEYAIELRNTYKISPVFISQFNREIADSTRKKLGELVPGLEDFKDSANTQESADVVIAPFYPMRYGLDTYRGYPNITGAMGNYFRYIFVLKRRGGKDMVGVPMRFLGECGYFEELPARFGDIEIKESLDSTIMNFNEKIKIIER